MFMAFRLERAYTKEEILELYVNSIYFGDGYYGIGDACEGYLNESPIEMTDYECTLMAGIPNAPSVYSLTEKSYFGGATAEYVVRQMVKYDYITEDQAQNNYKINSGIHKGNGFDETIKAAVFLTAIPTKL